MADFANLMSLCWHWFFEILGIFLRRNVWDRIEAVSISIQTSITEISCGFFLSHGYYITQKYGEFIHVFSDFAALFSFRSHGHFFFNSVQWNHLCSSSRGLMSSSFTLGSNAPLFISYPQTLNKNNLLPDERTNYFPSPLQQTNVYTTTYYPTALGKYDYRPDSSPSPCRTYNHSWDTCPISALAPWWPLHTSPKPTLYPPSLHLMRKNTGDAFSLHSVWFFPTLSPLTVKGNGRTRSCSSTDFDERTSWLIFAELQLLERGQAKSRRLQQCSLQECGLAGFFLKVQRTNTGRPQDREKSIQTVLKEFG